MKHHKKNTQLGMNHSTASHRLVKDILYNFIINNEKNKCYRCGKDMSRETFSIEHITPWLDSDNPIELYFDLNNISFSHLSCNVKAVRRPYKLSPEDKVIADERTRLKRNERYRKEYASQKKKRKIY